MVGGLTAFRNRAFTQLHIDSLAVEVSEPRLLSGNFVQLALVGVRSSPFFLGPFHEAPLTTTHSRSEPKTSLVRC